MNITALIAGIDYTTFYGNLNREITAVKDNSKLVQPGDAYVAIKGTNVNGHNYIADAVARGAALVVHSETVKFDEGINYLRVSDTALALARMAANFYNNPAARMKVVGVTGTNGKTTCATLLYNLFEELGYVAGLISTVEVRIHSATEPATHTTPNAIAIMQLMDRMVQAGCEYCFMEVSSHALVQERTAGIAFAGGIFTNITHDHLDYHQTFDAYIKAKQLFFNAMPKAAFALTNSDDRNGMVMVQNSQAIVKTYSLKQLADFKGRIIENSINGLHMEIEGAEVNFKMAGTFNGYNLLAVYATAMLLEQESIKVLEVLSGLAGAPGRFEKITGNNNIQGIVDYAHTPDAVENVLANVQKMQLGRGHIITVIGCGGNRDKAKRPQMAAIAARLSNRVILTSDNPRNEDPKDILNDMAAGIPAEKTAYVLTIADRAEAIKTACLLAQPGDTVVVCGKGHEKYQEILGVKHPFNDVEVLQKQLNP